MRFNTPKLQRLLKRSLESQLARRLALLGLGDIDGILKLCSDQLRSEKERSEAASLIGLLATPGRLNRPMRDKSSDILINMLTEGKYLLSWSAAVSLGDIGLKKITPSLLNLLRDSLDGQTRQAIVHVFWRLGDKRAAGDLIRILENCEESPQIRGAAAEAITTCGCSSKNAIAALTRALKDSSVEVRFFSAFALGSCAQLAARMDARSVSGLRLLTNDHAVLPGYGSVSGEARRSLRQIRLSHPAKPSGRTPRK